jgi:hypothetical protein
LQSANFSLYAETMLRQITLPVPDLFDAEEGIAPSSIAASFHAPSEVLKAGRVVWTYDIGALKIPPSLKLAHAKGAVAWQFDLKPPRSTVTLVAADFSFDRLDESLLDVVDKWSESLRRERLWSPLLWEYLRAAEAAGASKALLDELAGWCRGYGMFSP